MQKVLLVVVFLIVAKSSISQSRTFRTRNTNDLKNTRWVFKVENCCSNYYEFKEHGSYIYYSGEREEYSPGVYSVKKDTLFLDEFDSDENDPFEILDRQVKFIALIKGDTFQLLCRQDLIKTKNGEIKWLKTELEKPTFRKVGGSVQHKLSPK